LASNEFDPNFRKFNNYDKIETIKNSPCGSIVLIDEIDKAPRDFPNDLLSELEKPPFKFNIKELNDLEVQQNIQFPVFVIITSNSEKGLPDAFLRRCVFHNINFPGTKELLQIVKSNLKTDNPYFENVIVKFSELREKNLIKKPSTSELIDWIACLQQRNLLNSDICNLKYAEDDYKEKIIETLGIITKSKTDFETASRDISG
jgi:MoxR-like ATPase